MQHRWSLSEAVFVPCSFVHHSRHVEHLELVRWDGRSRRCVGRASSVEHLPCPAGSSTSSMRFDYNERQLVRFRDVLYRDHVIADKDACKPEKSPTPPVRPRSRGHCGSHLRSCNGPLHRYKHKYSSIETAVRPGLSTLLLIRSRVPAGQRYRETICLPGLMAHYNDVAQSCDEHHEPA